MRSSKFWLAAALATTAVSSAYSQTAAEYTKYSVVITTTVPKGSASETIAKSKKTAVPTNTKYTPCITGDVGRDQLSFTIKFDAGDAAENLRNFYVVLKSPTNKLYSLLREVQGGSLRVVFSESLLVGNTYTDLSDSSAYTHRDNNLGGAQTEILLGGNMLLDGLEPGLWSVTGIIAKTNAALPIMKPRSWAAWDTASFVVGSPWPLAGYACTTYAMG
ncbi:MULTISPECIES: hypothetical protein [Giesbergeria]|uniref:Uncharacterized protein n=1 Tax=Giesbergeria sinuosa TaxID=80883 RepID=A0ABV9QGP6_9BURK